MDSARIFNDLLLLLPFRLGPETGVTGLSENGNRATATLLTEAMPGALNVELLRAGDGDPCRIDRIRWQGSSPTRRPWGVGPGG